MRSHQLMTACTERNHQFQKRQMRNTHTHTASLVALLTNTVAKACVVLFLFVCLFSSLTDDGCSVYVCVLFIACNVVYGSIVQCTYCVCRACVFLASLFLGRKHSIHINFVECLYVCICCLNFDFVGVFEVDFVITAKLFNAKPSVFFSFFRCTQTMKLMKFNFSFLFYRRLTYDS